MIERTVLTESRLSVSLADAATMLGISRRTLEGYIRLKRLPARKLGRRTVLLVRDLNVFLRRDQPSASPPSRPKPETADAGKEPRT